MRIACFGREPGSRWHIDMPWDGNRANLEMVEGADRMLDALSSDRPYSTLNVELEEPEDGEYFTMEMEAHDEDGAFYNVKECLQFEGTVWLCNVVHEFFGNHPERIYCSVIE